MQVRLMTSVFGVLLALVLLGGCVRRTISITSSPEGALVWLNDKEIGRTPVETDFLFYGDYDVRLVHPEYEPIITKGVARAPLWDHVPLDLVAEMVPGEPQSHIHWHYELEPLLTDKVSLLERAGELRSRIPDIEEEVSETTTAAESGTESDTEPNEDPPSGDPSATGSDS